MKKSSEIQLPASQSMAAIRLTAALWFMALVAALTFGPDIGHVLVAGDENWEPTAAHAFAGRSLDQVSRAIGIGRASAAIAVQRDAFYGGFPTAGAFDGGPSSRPAVVEPAPVIAALPPVESPVPADGSTAPEEAMEPGIASVNGTDTNPGLVPTTPDTGVAQSRFRPTRILVVGASSIQFELGRELETAFETYQGVEVLRFGRHSTGLSRADYYDWMVRARELVDEFHPDLVVAQVGGNDCQGIIDADGDVVARWSESEQWQQAYFERVTEFTRIFADAGSRVVIVGMPIMRSSDYRAKMERLNDVTRRAVEAAGQTYVSTWEMTSDSSGNYTDEVEMDGRTRDFRADDGTHLSMYGAVYVTRQLMEVFERQFELIPAPETP